MPDIELSKRGDFYEAQGAAAIQAAKVLGIPVLGGGRIGIPAHSFYEWKDDLVEAGFAVTIHGEQPQPRSLLSLNPATKD